MPDADSLPFTPGAAPGSLSGQVIIVLGLDQSLLRPLARALAHLGAQVIVAQTADSGAETAALIQAEGALARFIRTDPDDEASLAALAEQTALAFGPVDVVVTLAPEVESLSILKLSAGDWDRLVSRPMRRALSVTHTFVPAMLTRGQGAFVHQVYDAVQARHAAAGAAQHGLIGFCQALAAEVNPQGVRVLAAACAPSMDLARLAGGVAYLLARPAGGPGAVFNIDDVLERAGYHHGQPFTDGPPPAATDRAANLVLALALGQQLAALLMDTDSDFDRLPVPVRPMARGAFMSKVGYRSQDVLRAVHKLGDQLQRMQASHSGSDSEFQVDFPRLVELFERLTAYYQALPDDTAPLTADQALLAQLRRQMNERAALIQGLLAALQRVHSP